MISSWDFFFLDPLLFFREWRKFAYFRLLSKSLFPVPSIHWPWTALRCLVRFWLFVFHSFRWCVDYMRYVLCTNMNLIITTLSLAFSSAIMRSANLYVPKWSHSLPFKRRLPLRHFCSSFLPHSIAAQKYSWGERTP